MPTVVLVSLDTLRAKSMSAYGYERETTPKLSQFAATATRFANAYTTFSNTFGSHISMLTGAYPGRHGIRTKQELSPDIPTLAERLRRAGYDTAAFTEDALLDATAGFQRGFSNYWENKAIQPGAGDAAGTFERGLAWLAGHRDRPAFLFLHTYAVHSPYKPSPPYDKMFLDTTQSMLASDHLAYEQEIRQLDDVVADLVARLDGLIPPERFVLVITADHGEEFWEHGGFLHGQLYDEILHIPLFVRWPGRVPAGRTLDDQVSLVDVTPTILDLVGLDPEVDGGLSLAPLLEGRADRLDRELIFAESPPAIWSRYSWSFIARGGGSKCFSYELPALDRCFDLVSDPEEQHPLQPAGDEAKLWESARTYAEAVITGAPPAPAKPAPSLHEDPQRVEKLRALGYLD
jgi:arylsulfatase A-like enzyme